MTVSSFLPTPSAVLIGRGSSKDRRNDYQFKKRDVRSEREGIPNQQHHGRQDDDDGIWDIME
jgi:hypothetical protein